MKSNPCYEVTWTDWIKVGVGILLGSIIAVVWAAFWIGVIR